MGPAARDAKFDYGLNADPRKKDEAGYNGQEIPGDFFRNKRDNPQPDKPAQKNAHNFSAFLNNPAKPSSTSGRAVFGRSLG